MLHVLRCALVWINRAYGLDNTAVMSWAAVGYPALLLIPDAIRADLIVCQYTVRRAKYDRLPQQQPSILFKLRYQYVWRRDVVVSG